MVPATAARSAQWLLIVTAAVSVAVFSICAAYRVFYPYEIMWMEGGLLDQVLRVTEGKSIYVSPSWEFTAYIYMPFYYYLSAAVSLFAGQGFASMRLVSLASSIAVAVLLCVLTNRATGQRLPGWLAGAFFLAAAKATDFSLDTGRVDALFVALLLAYYYTARYRRSFSGQILAAVFGIAALYTKQTAIIACAPVAIWLFLAEKDRLRFVTPVAGVAGALVVLGVLQWATDGWFSFYVLELTGSHASQWGKLPSVVFDQLLLRYGLLLAIAIIVLALRLREPVRVDFYPWLLVVTLAFSGLFPYVHTGSAPNILMPLQAGMALLLGLCLGQLERETIIKAALTLVAVAQFAVLSYRPSTIIPNAAWTARHDQFINCLQSLPQPVLNTRSGYVWRSAGTERVAHESAVADVLRAGDRAERTKLLEEMGSRLTDQYYGALILGAQMTAELAPLAANYYVDTGFTFGDSADVPQTYLVSKVFLSAAYLAENELPQQPVCESLAPDLR
jgi:4-amino-4-deoxy-L-arabinose transferase-like glycosyltransferase